MTDQTEAKSPTTQVIYKIRSKTTGLYSKGGMEPRFGKTGKVWKKRGDLSSHFTQLTSRGEVTYRQHDVEVLEYELREEQVSCTPVDQWINQAAARAAQRDAEAEAQRKFWQEQREREQRNGDTW
jgi:hypothetical protein